MKKIIVFIMVAAGLSFLGLQIHQNGADSRKSIAPRTGIAPVAIETAAIRTTIIQDLRSFTGTLYPFSEFILAPKITGRLERMLVHIGDTVEGGRLIAALEDNEYRLEVSQAEAELKVARANLQERESILENTRREYERTMALRKQKIASESELDAAESEYKIQQAKLKVAMAQVSQKEAALKTAVIRLAYTQIRVPDNNATEYRVVGERFVDVGAMLAPNSPIASILDIGTLIAVIHVIERDYSKFRPKLDAVISTDAFPNQTFMGKVVRVAPLLKEKSRQARVEIEVPNDRKLLKPGMFIRVQIQFGQRENATVVPVAAITRRNGTPGVFGVDFQKKQVRFIPVTVGIVSGEDAEVLDPPLSGSVVTLGHHLLEDGASVLLPGRSMDGDVSLQTSGKTDGLNGRTPAGKTTT